MNGDYFFFIASAYGIAAVVLVWVVVASISEWKKAAAADSRKTRR